MKLVAFCGFEGSGKDTAANYVVEKYGYTRLSFAKILKDVISIIFDWDRELLEGQTEKSRIWREEVDEWWSKELDIPNFTPRYALQHIATDVFRKHFSDKIWLLCLKKQMNKYDKVIITDCRFKNEFEFINNLDGTIIYIARDIPSWFNDYRFGNEVPEITTLHVSQYEWIRCKWHITINNIRTVKTLQCMIDNTFELNKLC